MQPNEIPIPKEPLKVALIGAGNRASVSYRPVFGLLKPWIELVAVCDPVEEHANAMAEAARYTRILRHSKLSQTNRWNRAHRHPSIVTPFGFGLSFRPRKFTT